MGILDDLIAGAPIEATEEESAFGPSSLEGIFSINVKSFETNFLAGYSVTIERDTVASYTPPDGYVKVSENVTVSTQGIAVIESYMPLFHFQVKEPILLTAVDSTIPKPTREKFDLKSLDVEKLKELMDKVYQPIEILKYLVKTVIGSNDDIISDSNVATCLEVFAPYFHAQVANLTQDVPKTTIETIMIGLYQGIGFILKQTGAKQWTLTDLWTLYASTANQQNINSSAIVSTSSGVDFRKVAKYTSMGLDENGQPAQRTIFNGVTTDNIRAMNDNSIQEIRFKGWHEGLTGASVGEATIAMAQPIPLIHFATLKGVSVSPSANKKTASVSFPSSGDSEVGQCFPSNDMVVQSVEKTKDIMRKKKNIKNKEEKVLYNLAPVSQRMKQFFYNKMRHLAAMGVVRNATRRRAVVDNILVENLKVITFGGGGISMEKALISSSSVTSQTESYTMNDTGLVTDVSVTVQPGFVTSSIGYVNLDNAFSTA